MLTYAPVVTYAPVMAYAPMVAYVPVRTRIYDIPRQQPYYNVPPYAVFAPY